jgi:hypothetical protein
MTTQIMIPAAAARASELEELRHWLKWALDTLDAEAFGHYIDHKASARAALAAAPALTHGRHCRCSACARQDWTDPSLAHCGMHGPSCPAVYDPEAEADRG